MSSDENKQIMRDIMDALAQGDRRPFAEAMADDFSWIIAGESLWSGAFHGKDVVRQKLMVPLFAQFQGTYTNRAVRLIAEGDVVVVECRGRVTTTRGQPYHNSYCYVCELVDGKLKTLTEYMDTALAERVLQPIS